MLIMIIFFFLLTLGFAFDKGIMHYIYLINNVKDMFFENYNSNVLDM